MYTYICEHTLWVCACVNKMARILISRQKFTPAWLVLALPETFCVIYILLLFLDSYLVYLRPGRVAVSMCSWTGVPRLRSGKKWRNESKQPAEEGKNDFFRRGENSMSRAFFTQLRELEGTF